MQYQTEPLAIVGIGLRLPGGINNPESFWQALIEGRNLIGEVPSDRWNIKSFFDQDRARIGKVYTRKGGFLNDIAGFDPEFFGISPYEAGFMDPQQRIMLEVTWEALEDGGIAPEKLAGTKTGVFIGASLHEYENLNFDRNDHRLYGTYSATGMGTSILANRISYLFDFKGPSIAIDTACSSSLVAAHLACQSILSGETDIGIAGGIQILIRPDSTMTLCKGGFISPDGCCRSFDAGANGYVRSEGAGAVVIKRLSNALKDNDPIYALICGSAVNQDGRSAGLTVPDENAQKHVIVEALAKAGIQPHDVQYVEAHGTGTPVGDPVEARSIGTVLSQSRAKSNRLIIGSAKSNLGHTESTAGMVGLVKAALMLKNAKIPANLHFVEPSPHIPFEELNIRVPTTAETWPDTGTKPKVAGVNSFGFGGTNAHVVLREHLQNPDHESNPVTETALPLVIPCSARSQEALKAVAADMSRFLKDNLQGTTAELADIAAAAALHKGQHHFRAAFVAATKRELADLLQAYVSEEAKPDVIHGRILQKKPLKTAFIFSGMGQQWRGMGRSLYQREPVFRNIIDRCSQLFKEYTQAWNLIEELFADEQASRIDETQISQPCIFAIQAALSTLWQAWGVRPDSIVGHSVGEVAGYFAAGVLSLEDAVKVCFHRSRLQQTKAGSGGMLAAGLSEKDAARFLQQFAGKVSIAAVNAAEAITFSGEIEALNEIAKLCENENIFHRFLKVEVPYHSAGMNSICSELGESLRDIRPVEGNIQVISTVTGANIAGTMINGDYWAENIRKPVLFKTVLDELIKGDTDIFVEISAHPVLSAYMLESLVTAEKKGTVVHSLKRGEDHEKAILREIAKIYAAGGPVAWQSLYPSPARWVKLPAYPWQNKPCWLESEESRKYRLGIRNGHPLLGEMMHAGRRVWNSVIDLSLFQYLKDHVVQGGIVFPAAAYIEMAFAAFKETYGANCAVLEEIEMLKPLLFNPEVETCLQLALEDGEKFSVFSRPKNDGADWTLHARGRFGGTDMLQTFPKAEFAELRNSCERTIEPETLYGEFNKRGLVYGRMFRGIEELWVGDNEAFGRISLASHEDSDLSGYNIHPSALDACFQILGAFGGEGTYLPLRFERAMLHASPGRVVFCHAVLTERSNRWLAGNLSIYGPDADLLLKIDGFTCQRMLDQQDIAHKNLDELLYQFEWKIDEECLIEGVPANHYQPDVWQLKHELHADLLKLIETGNSETRFNKAFNSLNRLCLLYIIDALKNSEPGFGETINFSAPELIERFAAEPAKQKLLEHFLRLLVEQQVLIKTGKENEYALAETAADELVSERVSRRWRKLLDQHPGWRCELSMLERYGSHLAQHLSGQIESATLHFADNSQTYDQFFKDSPTFRLGNKAVQIAIKAILKNLPEGHMVRVLEIGAGTGALTSTILPLLPTNRTRYCYTDVSEGILSQARSRFAAKDFIEYRIFDLQKKPEEQELPLNAFDLVISSMVFDNISDVHMSIDSIFRMTAAGGMFIVLEPAGEFSWYNFINEKTEKIDWVEVLKSNGFAEAETVFPPDSGNPCGLQLIIARKTPAEPAENPDLIELPVRIHGAEAGKMIKNSDCCVILADSTGIAEKLADLLRKSGIEDLRLVYQAENFDTSNPAKLAINPQQPDHYDEMLKFVGQNKAQALRIINLWNIGKTGLEADANCLHGIYLLQSLAQQKAFKAVSLWMITSGVHPLEGFCELALQQAPIWGLTRVMATEHPEIKFRTVDISPKPSDIELKNLTRFIVNPDNEDEFVLRDAYRFVHRLTLKGSGAHYEEGTVEEVSFCLEKGRQGAIDSLTFIEKARQAPGEGEIEIKIHATGVNVKDVLKTTGVFEQLATYDSNLIAKLGIECSGVVVAKGTGVDEFEIGDEVMGLAYNSFASHTTARKEGLIHKPRHLTFEEAASMPLSYLTAHYALVMLAKIKAGDRILIHTATGGVGMAAINIARKVGAEVFATAGSAEKRDFLKALGISYVGDSRSLMFADEISRLTNSAGVDIVLNTLPGKAIRKSMSILKSVTGRFVDISNIYNESLKVHFPEKGIALHAFDLERMSEATLCDLWKELKDDLQNGSYSPIPFRAYPMAEIGQAFKNASKGLHIGKCVISFAGQEVILAANKGRISLKREGSYLVTGGLRGFGLATAKWLAACGAENLVLAGRSGAVSDEARAALAELRSQGIRVTAEGVDVSDAEQVAGLMKKFGHSLPPLKGIVHAAMVLDDATLINMDAQRLKKVCDPKISGAWNLHTHSLGMDLDFFICYSSISAAIGNAGQGNYAAANFFLESLAGYRQQQGLPALTVSWGPMGEAGYVARNSEVRNHLLRLGMNEINLESAWQAICCGLKEKLPVLGVYDADWAKVAKFNRQIADSPKFAKLGGNSADRQSAGDSDLEKLLAMPSAERNLELARILAREIAKFLGLDLVKISVDEPISGLGIDSFTVVELILRIEKVFSIRLQKMVFFKPGLTIKGLAEIVEKEIIKASQNREG